MAETTPDTREHGMPSRQIAFYSIITALMVVLTLILIPMPQPIQFLGFAPVLIYFLGITIKPTRAFVVCAIGSVIGQLLASIMLGDYANLPIYLLGAFVARGVEGLLISVLEKALVRGKELATGKVYAREVLILVMGGTWEVFGYYLVGGPYYLVMYSIPLDASLLWYLPVFIDLAFVPVALGVVAAARASFQQPYLDRILFRDFT
jgi:uncharacterized membrane protein